MKKLIAAILVIVSTTAVAQDKKQMSGMYEGFTNGTYSFSDENEEYQIFDDCDPELLSQWDLKSDDLLYESFDVIYVITENADGDKIYKIVGITHLEEE